MSPGSLSVEAIETTESLHALRREWNQLAQAHGNGLPFATWEWHETWWKYFRSDRKHVQDRLFIQVFRDGSGKVVGIAPLMITQRLSGSALGVRVVDFIGADPNLTELRSVLCDPRWESAVYQALQVRLAERKSAWDWICWRGVRQGGKGEAVLAEQPRLQFSRNVVTSHVLHLDASSWEEFKSRCPRNLKESLRKCYNSLKREGHTFQLEIASTPEEVGAALDHFFRLHSARAMVDGTVQHRDVFGWTNPREFLRDVSERLSDAGALRIFQLRIGGEVVAVRIGFVIGDSLYLYYSGYDPAWAQHSVMTTTVAEAVRWALEQGLKTVNLSTGTDVSKTRWRPEQITYLSALQPSPSWRGRFMSLAYRAARPLLHPRVRKAAMRMLGRHNNWS